MSRRPYRIALVAAALLAGAAPLQAQQALPQDSLDIARRAARYFYAIQADSLMAMMTDAVIADLGGREGIVQGLTQLSLRAGGETQVVEERWNLRNGARQYWRTSKMTEFPDDFLFRVVLNGEGKISGLGMGPAAAAPPIDAQGPVLPKP